jgi:competence protein ComEA
VQQSTPSWRVFDHPTDAEPPGAGPRKPSSADPSSPSQPNVLLAAAALAGALLIGGIALAVALGSSSGATVTGPDPGTGAAGSVEPSGVAGQIVVDVAGAVVNPGLYRLGTGARVGDAIDAAGGFSPRVDVARVGLEVNLAATLTDGDQVRVPSRDDPAAPGSGGNGTTGAGGSGGAGGLVDLNTATQAELEELPGIGPVTAGKIIAARSEAPFKSIDELRERGLVGEKTFEQLKTLVTTG